MIKQTSSISKNLSSNQLFHGKRNFNDPLLYLCKHQIKQNKSEKIIKKDTCNIFSFNSTSLYKNSSTPNSTIDSINTTTKTKSKKKLKIIYNKFLSSSKLRNKILNIDEKIHLAQENKELLLNKKNEMFIEKYKEKEKRFNEMKKNSEKEKLILLNRTKKLNAMRRLRLKINNLIKKDDNICKDFQSKNSTFNNKILDFYSGDYYLNHSIKYQSNFHFDKSENGEAHDKTKMISRIYSMKNKKISKKILEKELKDNEKELILEDPVYFFQNNSKGDNNNNKKLTLAEKINQEEGHVFKKNYKDFIKFHMSKSQSKDKINEAYRKEFNDIDIKLKKIKNNINKTIYKKRTKEFIFKENKMEKKRNKIINNMVESLRINKKINVIDNNKKKQQQLFETPTKIKKKFLIKKDDDDIDNFNKEFSVNYFNKDELNMIKRYNEKIKNGFFSTHK